MENNDKQEPSVDQKIIDSGFLEKTKDEVTDIVTGNEEIEEEMLILDEPLKG
ncbi:hypothetical protein [Methanosarcina mazei]|uniref:hypothetical protein n=1 Tax=Methanosarcina mazei TaxID=2209 RepID=UPI000A4E5951|nr:hypothetical protein [Methanosarcina mazei]